MNNLNVHYTDFVEHIMIENNSTSYYLVEHRNVARESHYVFISLGDLEIKTVPSIDDIMLIDYRNTKNKYISNNIYPNKEYPPFQVNHLRISEVQSFIPIDRFSNEFLKECMDNSGKLKFITDYLDLYKGVIDKYTLAD